MKPEPIWKVSVAISPEAEDVVREYMTELLQQPAWIYTDARTGKTTASAYLLSQSELDSFAVRRPELVSRLRRLRASGLLSGRVTVRVQQVRREDWAESWKRHFKPFEVGSRLLVKPGWSQRQPKRDQALVVLDPGLSFGTGRHPTTRFCLEQLVKAREPKRPQSLLDLGTGSGILAIAAIKLGYSPVEAFDCDPEAVRIARENAVRNGVGRRIRLHCLDLRDARVSTRGGFSVVCANLMLDLLLSERDRIVRTVAPGGRLVLAGILRKEFVRLRRAYEGCGLQLVAHQRGPEWESGAFVRV